MSQLSIKFGLVALIAQSSSQHAVHGQATCVGNNYLDDNGPFTLRALNANNQPDVTKRISIYNAQGKDLIDGRNRYVTKRTNDKNTMCYPNGATEMFALPNKQHNGFEVKFKDPVKTFTLQMRDFGDFNSAEHKAGGVVTRAMKYGKIIARAMNGNVKVLPDQVVEFHPWEEGDNFWINNDEKLNKGDACTAKLENPEETGQHKFILEASGSKTFTKVLLLFESETKNGEVVRELIDSNTSWGQLCYESAPVGLTDPAPTPDATPTPTSTSTSTPTSTPTPTPTTTTTTTTTTTPTPEPTQPSCDAGGYAYDNQQYCKCPQPVVKGTQIEVSVCGDATYLLPKNVKPCAGPVSADPSGTGCPKKNDIAKRHCREEIMSYLTGGSTGNCKAPEDATCEKLGSGAWGCVFPGNCNTVNTCTEQPTCKGDYKKDTTGKCVLGGNGYPLATANNTNELKTDKLPKLTEGVNYKVASTASAIAVTSMTLVATVAMASIFG